MTGRPLDGEVAIACSVVSFTLSPTPHANTVAGRSLTSCAASTAVSTSVLSSALSTVCSPSETNSTILAAFGRVPLPSSAKSSRASAKPSEIEVSPFADIASIPNAILAGSDDEGVINAGIEAMSADGKTSISGGFEVARELFADDGNGTRTDAAKIVLFVSDGEQSELFAALDRTPHETALDAAALVKDLPATVFAWGFGNKVSKRTLEQIATDESKVVLGQNVSELMSHLGMLQDAACAASPPSNPSPPPSTEEVVLTMKLEASGTVDTDSIQTIVAGIAGVAPSAVTIEIKSSRLRRGLNEVTVPDGSVIVATIAVPASTTAAAVQESLSLFLSSAAAASNALGINVEVISNIVTTASSPPPPLLPVLLHMVNPSVTAAAHVDSSVTIIGGAATIAALLALLLFASR